MCNMGVRLYKGMSQYDNYNWCSICDKWLINKPKRCPNCNKLARVHPHYMNGSYHVRDVIRY
jgi:hypothetical protein